MRTSYDNDTFVTFRVFLRCKDEDSRRNLDADPTSVYLGHVFCSYPAGEMSFPELMVNNRYLQFDMFFMDLIGINARDLSYDCLCDVLSLDAERLRFGKPVIGGTIILDDRPSCSC